MSAAKLEGRPHRSRSSLVSLAPPRSRSLKHFLGPRTRVQTPTYYLIGGHIQGRMLAVNCRLRHRCRKPNLICRSSGCLSPLPLQQVFLHLYLLSVDRVCIRSQQAFVSSYAHLPAQGPQHNTHCLLRSTALGVLLRLGNPLQPRDRKISTSLHQILKSASPF